MISDDLVERLMRRAHTLNGRPVADGDGNTYIPGEYTRKDAALDQEAYAELSRLRAENERLREALGKLACRHVTVSPLWWQVEARKALEGE